MRTLGSSVWECVTVSDRTSGFTRRPSAAGDPGTLTWSSKSLPKAGRGARLRIPRKIKALPLLLAERATDRAKERERKVQRYGRALNGTGGQRNGPRDPHPTKPPNPPSASLVGDPARLVGSDRVTAEMRLIGLPVALSASVLRRSPLMGTDQRSIRTSQRVFQRRWYARER